MPQIQALKPQYVIVQRRVRWVLLSLLALLCFSTTAQAWSVIGHQKIAALSWQYLTPSTRAWIAQMSLTMPPCMALVSPQNTPQNKDNETRFIRLSSWPDVVRHQAGCAHHSHPLWHYRNIYWSPDNTPLPLRPTSTEPDIVVMLARLMTNEMANDKEMGVVDLAWLIHLVADIHQPLHLANRVTADTPRGDGGGNGFPLRARCQRCADGRVDNLHMYWDGLLEREATGDQEDIFRSTRVNSLRASMRSLEARYGAELAMIPIRSRAAAEWATESHLLVQNFAYPASLKKEDWPNADYYAQAHAIAAKQAVLAAYRLADALNQMASTRLARSASSVK